MVIAYVTYVSYAKVPSNSLFQRTLFIVLVMYFVRMARDVSVNADIWGVSWTDMLWSFQTAITVKLYMVHVTIHCTMTYSAGYCLVST